MALRISGRRCSFLLLMVIAGIARADTPTTAPTVWVEPAGRQIARLHARGFQVYTLTAGVDGKLAWSPAVPDATLSDDAGNPAGRHFKGPTWESTDGSKVVGRKLCERPSPNADSIPELQLTAKSNEGSGIFAGVKFIERLNTTGGKTPAVDPSAKAGDEARVPYTADYVFFAAAP